MPYYVHISYKLNLNFHNFLHSLIFTPVNYLHNPLSLLQLDISRRGKKGEHLFAGRRGGGGRQLLRNPK